MTAAALLEPLRELAHRVSGGVEVTLYWSADDNRTSIQIWQHETNETLAFPVPREHALDAFYHPFAHLRAVTAELPHQGAHA